MHAIIYKKADDGFKFSRWIHSNFRFMKRQARQKTKKTKDEKYISSHLCEFFMMMADLI
jgi:hypothetical protein